MPQFDFTTYSSQIFWFAICFAALYLSMHFIVLPRIRDIIGARKKVVDTDLSSAEELDAKIAILQNKTDSLRKEAGQKYQSQLEEASKNALKQREKNIEELKVKIDDIALKSRQEIKNFIEQSQVKSQSAIENLIQTIKAKIFN